MTIVDRLLTALRRFLRPTPAPPLLSPEELQRLFTARYRCFRELLAANTNTLEAMAELEKALRDGRTLSMTFIRARCTLVTVNVYKIVHNLNKIADGRYSELERIFSRLQQSIEALLEGDKGRTDGEPVLPLERIGRAQADLTGEKMANLGEAGSLAGIRIPPGFALTAVATRLFFQRNQSVSEDQSHHPAAGYRQPGRSPPQERGDPGDDPELPAAAGAGIAHFYPF